MKKIIDVYRCEKKQGAYLYVEKGKDLSALPEVLLKQAGNLELALTMVLTPERKLERANARNVLAAIAENGFYLQMPPSPDAYMQTINNNKMPNKPLP